MKYSIITPNYNGFHLMSRYFDSLKSQSIKDFEVIIVDDCSTDDSYEKLLEYARNSSLNIKVFRSTINSGPGNARNIGMNEAHGEWITFVDNDDWVKPNFLEEIDNIIVKNNDINCVVFDYIIKTDNIETVSHSMYFGEEGRMHISDCIISCRNHTVGKFYKLSDCRKADVKFPMIRRCEDVAFVASAIEACGNAYYHKAPLYYYYQRPVSLSNNNKLDEHDMVEAFNLLYERLGEKYHDELCEKSVADLFYGGLLMMCKANKNRNEIKGYILEYKKRFPNWRKSRLLPYLGKAKGLFLMFADKNCILPMKILAKAHSIIISRR